MTSQGEDTDEEYLDDPIKLVDFQQLRVGTEPRQKIENIGYEPTDSDNDVLIEKKTSSLPGRFAVTLPVTFFDYSRNIRLLNECKPFVIKVVDVRKHQWYYRNQRERLDKNVIVIDDEPCSIIEVQRKKSTLYKDIDKRDVNIHNEALKLKIKPVDITDNALLKQIRHMKEDEKKWCLEPPKIKKADNINFKKNVGLVGLKISYTVDLDVSNAKTGPENKKELQSIASECVDSEKLNSTSSSDKQKPYSVIDNKTKQQSILKIDQDNIKLTVTNEDTNKVDVNVKKPITFNNNKTNTKLTGNVRSIGSIVMNEYVIPNEEKHDKIKKAVENRKLIEKQALPSKLNSVFVRHEEFDAFSSKLLIGSQKISKKVTESKDIKDSKEKINGVSRTGKIKAPSGCKKDKNKVTNEQKDNISDASKNFSVMKATVNKDNVLKMVISTGSSNALIAGQKSKSLHYVKKSTEDQTTFSERTQDTTYNGKQHNTCDNVPIGKSLLDSGLRTNNNVLNHYQISSNNNPFQFSQQNFSMPAVGNNQLRSFYDDNSGQSKNSNAHFTKTYKPESHIVSGSPTQISINSHNGKGTVLVQNTTTRKNSLIHRTPLPPVTIRHSNLPNIIQQKRCFKNTNDSLLNVNNTLAAVKPMETKESETSLAYNDVTTNKQVNAKQSALRVYRMFNAKDNVIGPMTNQGHAVSKSNVNSEERSTIPGNQVFTQVVEERRNTSDGVVIDHQLNSGPVNRSETHGMYVRRNVSKSYIVPKERSHNTVDQVSTQVVQEMDNISDGIAGNRHSNSNLFSHSAPQEIFAGPKSDTAYYMSVGNNTATSDGANNVPVTALLPVHHHLNGTPVTPQGSYNAFTTNGNQILSFAQNTIPTENNVQHRSSMAYTNNKGKLGSNMNRNDVFTGDKVGFNVLYNKQPVSNYQPIQQNHVAYRHQPQPIQTFIGNRPTQGQKRPTQIQRSIMNMVPVDQCLPYQNKMRNGASMKYIHCAPIYNNIPQDINRLVQESYYNPNQSNNVWFNLYPPPPPPPPVQTTGTFFPPTTVNALPQAQSTFVPPPVANSSSIIGRNNSGIIRKINIVAVPNDKENPPKKSSACSNPVYYSDDRPANSKIEMLEELTKVTTDITLDSPVKEKNIPVCPPTKPHCPKLAFSEPSDHSPTLNNQSGSITNTHTLKEGVLSATKVVDNAPKQVVSTLNMNEHNISTMTLAKLNVSSPELSKQDSSIKSPPKQTIANFSKSVTESPSTEASSAKCDERVGLSSPKIQNHKRPHPVVKDNYPELQKILTNRKYTPGPLSKKLKLDSSQKSSSFNRYPRGKFVSPAANTGYSPPILPILTYEKTFEYIAQAHSETRDVVEKDDFRPYEDKLPTSINSSYKNNYKKRNLCEVDKQATQDSSKNNYKKRNLCEADKQAKQNKSVKKISLDEYKKRAVKKHKNNSEKDYNLNNLTNTLECRTKKIDDVKQSSDLDLGYDSDSTIMQ